MVLYKEDRHTFFEFTKLVVFHLNRTKDGSEKCKQISKIQEKDFRQLEGAEESKQKATLEEG